MNNLLSERNERRSRNQALVLAVSLHLGLAAALYLGTSDKPAKPDMAQSAHPAQVNAKPRQVNMP